MRKLTVQMLIVGLMLVTTALSAETSTSKILEKRALIESAFKCNIAAETIAKSYLYIGAEIATRQAKKEQKRSLDAFVKNYKILSDSINDPKIKNLLLFTKMSYDVLEDTIKEPYNLDNAQIILDLTATISESTRHIANTYKKLVNYSDPVSLDGLIPSIESIAKYYIAYQSGIKDDNTIKLMNKTVKFCQNAIDTRSKYPQNTVAMNQSINKVNRLWDIVHKFYLDIDQGGLPFIVFKTTSTLEKKLRKYNKLNTKLLEENAKATK